MFADGCDVIMTCLKNSCSEEAMYIMNKTGGDVDFKLQGKNT